MSIAWMLMILSMMDSALHTRTTMFRDKLGIWME